MSEEKGLSVLIADDDYVTRFIHRKILQNSLREYQTQIAEVENGAQAFHFIKSSITDGQKPPDLVLVDINMPYMNGFEFVDSVMQLNPINKPEFIIISSSDNSSDKKLAQTLGIKHFLTKPVDPDRLRAIILQLFSD